MEHSSFRTVILGCLVYCLCMAPARALVYPDRPVLLNPLTYKKVETGWNFFPLFGGWAEGGHYAPAGRAIPDHAWNTKLGAAAEVLRLDSSLDLTLSSDIELVSDSRSRIGFNPRSFFWQQAVMVSGYMPPWGYWQTGIVHRCKHDIDTLGLSDETGKRRETVMIYDSMFLRVITNTMSMTHSSRFPFAIEPYARFDIFIIRDDKRIRDAAVPAGRTVEDLSAALGTGVNCDMIRMGPSTLYLRGRYMLNCYGMGRNSDYTGTGSFETGVSFRGGEGIAGLFAMLEYQDMTMINPYNESKLYFLFGVRISDGRMYH